MAVALACEGLWKIYEMGDEKVQAVRGIDLEIKQGEMVAANLFTIYLEYLVGPFFGPLRHLTKYFSRFGILSV